MSENITGIPSDCFYSCTSLKNIEIPNSVTNIDYGAFYKCISLEEVRLPNSLVTLGEYAFAVCNSLKSIEIPNSVTKIDDYAFEQCESLGYISIPNGVTYIGSYVFFGTVLRYINIPNTVETIKHDFLAISNMIEATSYVWEGYVDEPLTGEVVHLDSIEPSKIKGKTLYMKYDIAPTIDLCGGTLAGGDIKFPAWI